MLGNICYLTNSAEASSLNLMGNSHNSFSGFAFFPADFHLWRSVMSSLLYVMVAKFWSRSLRGIFPNVFMKSLCFSSSAMSVFFFFFDSCAIEVNILASCLIH